MHRLLQWDLSEYFKNSENKETTRETFIEKIDENFSDANNGDWRNEYNAHLHAISLIEKKKIKTDKLKKNEINKIISIFHKLGAYYQYMQSKYQLALRNAQNALEMRERIFPGDHRDKAISYNSIGEIYKDMGDLNKSLEYSTKALEMRERLFQGDHQDKAISYNSIGEIYKDMGDLNKKILTYHYK